tara:strand:- start:541 stop:1485 length:945 start_codon:yes stop_codon:yes gene_type:complete
MKLLFENWRKFVNEQEDATVPAKPDAKKAFHDAETTKLGQKKDDDPQKLEPIELNTEIQKENAKQIFLYYLDEKNVRDIFQLSSLPKDGQFNKMFEEPAKVKRFIDHMVAANDILGKNKIVEFLGAGSFGFVVLLDNNHALKIYSGSFDPLATDDVIDPDAKTDRQRYQKSQEKAFSGKGDVADLHIYDEGELKLPTERTWYYAEMPELIKLSSHMRFVHKDKDIAKVTTDLDMEITRLKYIAKDDIDNKTESDINTVIQDQKIVLMDREFAKNLLDQLRNMLKTKSFEQIEDVRGANIGIMRGKEQIPVIFDY